MELASVVERAFASREQRLKAKKPAAAAPEETAMQLPQQPKSLQGVAPSREDALADLTLEEEEKDAAPCPAGDLPPGGRAEQPCDFPAVESSVSATDVRARLRALRKQAEEVARLTDGIRGGEYGDSLSTADKATEEATRMLRLVNDWMDALGLEDDV